MKDDTQKEICRICGISAKSVVKCSQTAAPECAYMQMALVYAAQHSGEVQQPMSLQSTVEYCKPEINKAIDEITKVVLKGTK